MNKIVYYFVVALFTVTLFSSCKEEDNAVKQLDLFLGTYTGTLKAVKGENVIYEQQNVTITITHTSGNYCTYELSGDYTEMGGIELATKLPCIAKENFDGVSYDLVAKMNLQTIPRLTPFTIRKTEGKVTMNITFADAKPYTIVDFIEN